MKKITLNEQYCSRNTRMIVTDKEADRVRDAYETMLEYKSGNMSGTIRINGLTGTASFRPTEISSLHVEDADANEQREAVAWAKELAKEQETT